MHTLCYNVVVSIQYKWNPKKNEELKSRRSICFEQIVMQIEKGNLLDIIEHPNQNQYGHQKILIVNINNYAYLVPYFEVDDDTFSLITIIPSRKATKRYIGGNK